MLCALLHGCARARNFSSIFYSFGKKPDPGGVIISKERLFPFSSFLSMSFLALFFFFSSNCVSIALIDGETGI